MKSDRSGKNTRRPGAEWRFVAPARNGNDAYKITNTGDAEFDEIVVDDWLHVERMSDGTYWARIGEHEFDIQVSRNTKVPSVATMREDSRA